MRVFADEGILQSSQPASFIIVDDEVLIARDLAAQIRDLGYNVLGMARTIPMALSLIEQNRPDIVLMDVQLGFDEDGVTGAQRIRSSFGIPSIYITAYSDQETLVRAQQTKPLGYILKPFRTHDLKSTLLMAITQHSLARAADENRSWLHTVLSSTPDALIATDSDDCIRLMNPAAEQLTGYRSASSVGRSLDEVVRLRDSALHNIGLSSHLFSGTGVRNARALLSRRDGNQVAVEYTTTEVLPGSMKSSGRLIVIRDISVRDRIEKHLARERDLLAGRVVVAGFELDRTKDELRSLSAQLMHAQDQERRRIARDLHDDLAQQLAVLQVDAGRIAAGLPASEVRDEITRFQQRLAAASEGVRTLSHQLHPSVLDDLGLAAALRQIASDFAQREDVPVRFNNSWNSFPLRAKMASGIFRIAQEALRNIARHARGAAVSMRLSYGRKCLRLSVRDYGPGFDAVDARYRGLGLISMQERARAMGGTLSIRSKIGVGTLVTLRVDVARTPTSAAENGY